MMSLKYEYKFIRIGKGLLWPKEEAEKEYKSILHQHAQDGWRLVQIFAPSIGIYGLSRFYEVILERQVNKS